MINQESIRQFVTAIKNTQEFIDLKHAKEIIDQNGKLKQELETYQKRQADLQSSCQTMQEFEDKLTALNQKFSSLFRNPDMQQFLKASDQFGLLLMKVYQMVDESLQEI
ncbi:control of competence regulator comk ylbf/ymca [Lucifera butyrica]|uniref:Control of competence regulator comk ylbf/ymca n=1 Tax=Lucifera butyrica TaxID=1351585 RepID=A0A498R4D7_9FIRM|nr:YlbF family regulator [Lucifera butyrica]VBB06294.1 control of competence regulator comk ylbf/ymca [Lucifera butyrica]